MNATRDRADVALRLLDSRTLPQAPDRIVVMRSPARIFAVKIGWNPQIYVLRKLKPLRQHANNGEDRIVNFQAGPGKVRRPTELLLPISVTDKSNGSGPLPRIRETEFAPDDRLNTENLEKFGGDAGDHRACRLRGA